MPHLLLCIRAKPNKRILQGSFSGRREVLDFLRVQTQNAGSFLKIEIDGIHVADGKIVSPETPVKPVYPSRLSFLKV